MLAQCPYTTTCIYSDNGRKYQGNSEHLFAKTCNNNRINQNSTKPAYPQMNGKAEKSDTNFELRCGIISIYLAIQKIENKN